MEIIAWVVTGISAAGGVLAWIAKLRWSKEFSDAKNEVIKTKQAEIDFLKSQIDQVKSLFDPDSVMKHISLKQEITRAKTIDELTETILEKTVENILAPDAVLADILGEFLSFVLEQSCEIHPDHRIDFINTYFSKTSENIIRALEEFEKSPNGKIYFNPNMPNSPWERKAELMFGAVRIACEIDHKHRERFLKDYFPLTHTSIIDTIADIEKMAGGKIEPGGKKSKNNEKPSITVKLPILGISD